MRLPFLYCSRSLSLSLSLSLSVCSSLPLSLALSGAPLLSLRPRLPSIAGRWCEEIEPQLDAAKGATSSGKGKAIEGHRALPYVTDILAPDRVLFQERCPVRISRNMDRVAQLFFQGSFCGHR